MKWPAAIVLVAIFALATGASAIEGPALIRVQAVTDTEREVNGRFVQASWINDRRGRRIGWAIVACVDLGTGGPLGSGTSMCFGTYLFPKGRVQTAGTRKTRSSYFTTVVGGTGLYSNASGTLLVRTARVSPRTETLLFSLEP